MNTRHLFLMAEGFAPTVIDSQVLDTILALEREGLHFDLTAVVNAGEWLRNHRAYKERRQAYESRIQGKVTLVPGYKMHLGPSRWAQALLVSLGSLSWKKTRLVIHARGHTAASIAVTIKKLRPNTRVVYDVRGDALAEYNMVRDQQERTDMERRSRFAREAIQRAVAGADAMFCVSEKLKQLMIEQFGADGEQTHIIPCLADSHRFLFDPELRETVRRRESLTDKLVLVFPGSTGRWHYLEPTLQVVRTFMEEDERVFFVGLTPQVEEMGRLADSILPPGRHKILRAAHDEIPGWLNAADRGLLLREKHPVNAVAAPTKFAEYMLCGLPIMISDGIGDYSKFVQTHNAGLLLQEDADLALISEFKTHLASFSISSRQSLSELGNTHFSKKSKVPVMVNTYQLLSS